MKTTRSMSLLDYINTMIEVESRGSITLDDFTEAMQSGDKARIDAAVEAMYEAGGYDNLA